MTKTKSPVSKLDVRGGVFGNNQEFGINLGVPDGQWMSGMFLRSNSLGQPRLSLDVPIDGEGSTGEVITINNLQRVGIGTINPNYKLTVSSGTKFDGLMVRNATTRIAQVAGADNDNDNGFLQLYNNDSATALIKANGSSSLLVVRLV